MTLFRQIGLIMVASAALLLNACASSASTTATVGAISTVAGTVTTTTGTPAPGGTATATALPSATTPPGSQSIHAAVYGVQSNTGGFSTLFAVNADTGQTIWSHTTTSIDGDGFITVANGEVVLNFPGAPIQAYDAHTGAVRWVSHATAAQMAPLIVGSTEYVSPEGQLFALDITTGAVRWQANTVDTFQSPLVDGSNVYALGKSGTDFGVATFDAQTGAAHGFTKLSVTLSGESDALLNGVLYTPCNLNALCAFDVATGAQKWQYPIGVDYDSHAIFANGTVYVGTNDHYLYAVDATTGKLRFRSLAQSSVHATPIVANGIVYFGCGTKFYALDASTGASKWVKAVSPTYLLNSGITGNSAVYLSLQGGLTALTADTGQTLWTGPLISAGAIAAW